MTEYCMAADCMAEDCMAEDCMAEDCMAEDCMVADCMAEDCMTERCMAECVVIGICRSITHIVENASWTQPVSLHILHVFLPHKHIPHTPNEAPRSH